MTRGERVHIAIFGRTNSGKSSLVNALTGQQTSIVSEVAGTTTDAVQKNMELQGVGAVVLIDTAGFDDRTELGQQRCLTSRIAAERCDAAIVVCNSQDVELELPWFELFARREVPVLAVLNKADLLTDCEQQCLTIGKLTGVECVAVSSLTGAGIGELRDALGRLLSERDLPLSITDSLCRLGDTVLLVMPQDSLAPAGRLILPQVQTIRELLDKRCTVVGCTAEGFDAALAALSAPPHLVITDSQVFDFVAARTPKESLLTSFSVLLARVKGDVGVFVEGAKAIDRLNSHSRVLIAEACTHAPDSEDIGRVKIPRLLLSRAGEGLRVDVVAGNDFPTDLTPYDLVIHCGACMFNRRHVLSRIAQAQSQRVPITNYGIAIARLKGILDRVVLPE